MSNNIYKRIEIRENPIVYREFLFITRARGMLLIKHTDALLRQRLSSIYPGVPSTTVPGSWVPNMFCTVTVLVPGYHTEHVRSTYSVPLLIVLH